MPPAAWQQDAIAAAQSYWHNAPPWSSTCPTATVTYAPLDINIAGETVDYCQITISSSLQWIDPGMLCLDVTHEMGHVVLGPDAFPANTADPAHSTDPHNIMYPVIFQAQTPQCTAMLNKYFPPPRHHHRRHRHRKHHR